MAGLMSKVAQFARSPQGRELTEKAKRYAADPKNKAKVEQVRDRLTKKR